MDNYKVVCVDAKNKPVAVPPSSWIENGETYTVVGAKKAWSSRLNKFVLAYKLKEVQMPPGIGFDSYISDRFRPYTDEDANSEKALEELLLDVEEELLVEL